MRFFVVPAGIILTLAGCATQDQLRQNEAQQGQAVQALRADANRSESGLSDLRAEIRRTQDTVHELEVALTDARARTDAAKVQADNALATSREFLANLIAAREEQRHQLDQNGVVFADLRRKLADLETRLQAQQRMLEQNASVLSDGTRRLYAVEAGLQEVGRRSTLLEAKAKTAQETGDGLTRQLAGMRKQVEDTRAAMGSESLLQMMRELEDMRRNSASLRGSIDELRKAQADSAAQSKNYYLDLDSRVRQLKQPDPPPVRQIESTAPVGPEPAPASQ
ncbi:MAG TPA: YbgF trimerization domain-containing protein [Burkholderiales bacterium]